MASPTISIIIPLYNKAPYVGKALESVRTQTWGDYECLVIDDGSTDGSRERAEEWISRQGDSRFRLIGQTNAGVAATRNRGVGLTSGPYLTFLDADDWWDASFLEQLYALSQRHPEAGLWASNYIYYKPGKTRIGATELAYVGGKTELIEYPLSYYRGTGMPVWTGATLVSREVFRAVGGFPEPVRIGEDFLLWAHIALHYPIAYLDRPLAYYNNSLSSVQRATGILHAPEHNMLFHLAEIEQQVNEMSSPDATQWKLLLDKLRIYGLLPYWIDKRYHDAATAELAKVEIELQEPTTRAAYRLYSCPVWYLRFRETILAIGSRIKTSFLS